MIRLLIDVYIGMIIVDAILSYFPQYKNKSWALKLRKVVDFSCAPIRRLLPPDLPFDFSPLVVILGIQLLIFLIQLLW
jgi:YggT family protein